MMRLPPFRWVATYRLVELASVDLDMRSLLSQSALYLLAQLGPKIVGVRHDSCPALSASVP
jgi:hypothetical protein